MIIRKIESISISRKEGLFLLDKRLSLLAIILILPMIVSGCSRKTVQQPDQYTQVNTAQLIIPLLENPPQNHVQIVQGTVGSTTEITMQDLNKIENTKYPDIVAEVGDSKITGLELTRKIAVQRNAFVNNIKKPQDESFYEKIALGLLMKDALIDNEVTRQGLTATVEEAKSYLEQQDKSMDLLPESDPAKVAYFKTIKDNGFNNASDYINSSGIVSMTQKSLGRGKLKSSVLQSIPKGQNSATKAWEDYTDKLINQGNYKIFVPVDIKGFQQLEDRVVLGK